MGDDSGINNLFPVFIVNRFHRMEYKKSAAVSLKPVLIRRDVWWEILFPK